MKRRLVNAKIWLGEKMSSEITGADLRRVKVINSQQSHIKGWGKFKRQYM